MPWGPMPQPLHQQRKISGGQISITRPTVHYRILILKTAVYPCVNGDGSITAKIIKKVILPTITLPECQRDAE